MRPDDTPEHKAANLRDGELRLQAVVEAAAGAEIIGEDLGWVPDYVRPHLERLGIAGFRIPHWDSDGVGNAVPGDWFPECSFATYSTHDHEPLGAMWNHCRRAADERGEAGASHVLRLLGGFAGIPQPAGGRWPRFTDCIQWRLFKALLDSRSRYASIMATELFNQEDRINSPGTTGGANWRFRLTVSPSERKAAGDKLASIIGATRRG
jgi:4-alpha-glucanotransferase